MAARASGGVITYPLIVLFLGSGAGLPKTAPAAFAGLLGLVVLIALARHLLIWKFDALYDRFPRLWQIGFFGGLLTSFAAVGGLFYWILLQRGPTPISVFAVCAAATLSALSVFVYAPVLWIVQTNSLLLLGPVITGMTQSGWGLTNPWIGLGIALYVGYLSWTARQQHRERWEALATSHQLALHAADLERAQVELRQARDELERQVAERTRELERTSREYRDIFENAHDPILVFRPEDERVLNVNRRACEVYGLAREEFIGLSLKSISENVEWGEQQIEETLRDGTYNKFESVQFRKDGSKIFLEINASAIEYDGRPAILSVNRDVTERRRAEELRLAKEAAERTAQAKAQFLANMSHEIRTPMAGIIGVTDLLLKSELGDRQREYARLIHTSAGSLLRVIDDILDFSKIEAGKLNFERVPFDLRALLHDSVELLRLGALARGTSLELDTAEDLPSWVAGDPGRLRQVLLNLVGNAVKFTEDGWIRVSIRTEAGAGIRVLVQDSGIGVPLEAQGRLFELFSQADGSTARVYGGTGLGLAISKRIVEAMGGEIGFESTPGKGSTFWFTVALKPATPPEVEKPSGERPVRGRRILAAEDNLINQLVVTEELKALGYEVTPVGNGLEAVEAVKTGRYDLVLMDCQMPVLDGYEAAQRIRQLAGSPGRIPIVALTAHALREDLERCLAVGMNDYLTKPFREDSLRQKLDRWLGDGAEVEAPAGGEESSEEREGIDRVLFEQFRELARASGHDFLRQLAEGFRSRPHISEMHAALLHRNRQALKFHAHSLKGSSSMLGAARLSQLCASLERMAQEASDDECSHLLAQIESEYTGFLFKLMAVV